MDQSRRITSEPTQSTAPEITRGGVENRPPGSFDKLHTTNPADHDIESNVSELQSDDQVELLGAIDKLRREHIDADISIPQIVVCGDQSSGKSSVLEAIAGVPFPVNHGTTTRFATEVILRQASERQTKVTIIPHADRRLEEKAHLADFKPDLDARRPQDVGPLIEAAVKYLEKYDPDRKFWKDRLRAEISGPTQPHLTLVDLPGIIQMESEESAMSRDKDNIRELVKTYIRNSRTIVLAVVTATADMENQEIIGLVGAQDVGNAKERTLGVITKPDRLVHATDEEKSVVSLARNERYLLRHGWHVLRNLQHDEKDRSSERRDETERKFFSTGAFSSLNRTDVGITELRKKLGRHLFTRITLDYPKLMDDMQHKLDQCKDTIERLGPARNSVDDQKAYLSRILPRLQRLVEASLDGDYEKSEFSTFFDGAEEKGLRDLITNSTVSFAASMRTDGRQFHVRHDKISNPFDTRPVSFNFYAPYTTSSQTLRDGAIPSRVVNLRVYCKALAKYMSENRGKSLPGLLSPRTVQSIFRQLSVPWAQIARQFVDQCYNSAQEFLKMAVNHVAGTHTGQALMQEYIYPAFDKKHALLESKLNELLWPFRECHPMIYNRRYGDRSRITEAYTAVPGNDDAEAGDAKKTWGTMAREARFEKDETEAADAFDKTEDYYEIALDTFIENVACLAIEACLLDDLPRLIPVEDVSRMDSTVVERIAEECGEAREERSKALGQRNALEEVIRTCRKHPPPGFSRYGESNVVSVFLQQDPGRESSAGRLFGSSTATSGSFGQVRAVSSMSNLGEPSPPRAPFTFSPKDATPTQHSAVRRKSRVRLQNGYLDAAAVAAATE